MAEQKPPNPSNRSGEEDLLLLRRFSDASDEEAFQILVTRYQNLVWSTCWRVLGNSSDVEDAVQDTFIALAKNAAKIESNLAAWLHSTAFNRSISLIRSEAARRQRELEHHHERAIDSQDDLAWIEMQDLIDICFSELDEDERELIIQRFYCKLTQVEIGEKIGIGQQAVGVRLKKTLQQLRHSFKTRGLSVSIVALSGALRGNLANASVPAQLTASLLSTGTTGSWLTKTVALLGAAKFIQGAMISGALVAALSAVWFFGLRDPIDKSRSVQYVMTTTSAGQVVDTQRIMILDRYLKRQESLDAEGNVFGVSISNLRTGKIISLDPQRKAFKILAKQRSVAAGEPTEVRNIRSAPKADLYEAVVELPEDAVEKYPEQQLNGRTVVGFYAETNKGQQHWKRTYWVDLETRLPVKVESHFSSGNPGWGEGLYVRDHFVFGEELSLSLFSTDPPEGYSVQEGEIQGIRMP